jgi:hypothetical protein
MSARSPLLLWGLAGAMVLALAWPVFLWTVARVEVEPDTFLVVTNLWGKPLPDGELVAPDPSYKGIQRRVLPEGRHFLNPFFHSYERRPVTRVPEKFCAVLVRKSGAEIDAERRARGEFLARGAIDLEATHEPGERGIVEPVLGPGKYRLNPHVYDVQVVPAVEIESQQVGVKVLRWGPEPDADRASAYVVSGARRGVQGSFVPSGTHYVNPYVTQIIPVDVRSHTVVFDDIEFPSRDGFKIQPRVQVRYKVNPERAPEIFVMFSEGGVLHQADTTHDDQHKNPILQKLILPLIRGYVRIEGSKHDAREYISKPKEDVVAGEVPTNPRERLQRELMAKVRPECEQVGVIVDYIAVGQPELNASLEELAAQIREREQARITRKTNEQKVAQYDQEQELKSTEALAEQRKKTIDATTKLERAKINAARRVQNVESKLRAELASAEALLEGAKRRAEAIRTAGKAEAAVAMADNEATVAGLRTAIDGFGSPAAYARYQVLQKLAPALTEVFASDQGEFATFFSKYMVPPDAGEGGAATRAGSPLADDGPPPGGTETPERAGGGVGR